MKYVFGENTVAIVEPQPQGDGTVAYYADVRAHISKPKRGTPRHWEACPAGGIMACASSGGYWCDEEGNPE